MRDKKILVIDDSKHDRFIIQTHLSEAGYENLIFAETGEEGIEKAKTDKPELVVVDLLLPTMGGFEVCKKIKEELGESTKVIVMTGYLDEVTTIGAIRESNADEYVVKTMGYEHLIEAVKKLL